MMDAQVWIQLVANIGGMGALAYVLYTLHANSITEFTKQLSEERALSREQANSLRQGNLDLWKSYMELKLRQHEQLVALLVQQDKMLDRIDGGQQRVMEMLHPTQPLKPQ